MQLVNLKLDNLPWLERVRPEPGPQEKLVLRLKLSGYSNKETAQHTGKPIKTIETQKDLAISKLHKVLSIEKRGLPFLYIDLLIRDLIEDKEIGKAKTDIELEPRERAVLMLHMLGYRSQDMPPFLKHVEPSIRDDSAGIGEYDLSQIKIQLGIPKNTDSRNSLLARTALNFGLLSLEDMRAANQWRLEGKHPLTGAKI